MNIGIYLSDIKPSDGGIFQYSLYLLRMLNSCDKIEHISVFINKGTKDLYFDVLDQPKIHKIFIDYPGKLTGFLKQFSDFWLNRYYMRQYPKPLFLKFYKLLNPDRYKLNSYTIDLLHVPRPYSPAYRLKYPVVLTMHDVQHFHFPEFFTPIQRIQKAITYHVSVQEADHIIVSFSHIKNDLVKYFQTEESKISVCGVPLTDDWLSGDASGIDELRSRYPVPDDFILTPAATWEHKNHLAILEALNMLRQEDFRVCWVATGHKTPFYKNICRRIKELGLEDQVLFTGVVSDKDLKGLYSRASLVVIPTLYEAGSGPLFEAMRYSVPVICSSVTSLPETIGDMDFVFDPRNISDMALKIKKGLTDTDYILRNKANSIIQTEKLLKRDYRQEYTAAYSRIISGGTVKKQLQCQKN